MYILVLKFDSYIDFVRCIAMRDERQQLLEKIHEKEAQLLAVKGENDSKQQVIDHLESSVQDQKIENEQLKAEQKQWHLEKVTLVQERDRLQQDEQRWLREREELKEEGKQQQQKFHDLEQQLQEKMKQKEDLEREKEGIYHCKIMSHYFCYYMHLQLVMHRNGPTTDN